MIDRASLFPSFVPEGLEREMDEVDSRPFFLRADGLPQRNTAVIEARP